jgi:acyl-CoA hydrolase
MKTKTGKRPSESVVESRYLLMPDEANPYGTAFGGVIVAWIDMVASMAAQRHCGQQVVTARIESLSFKAPVRIGEHVVLRAEVQYVGRSSMEVGVEVWRENPYDGKRELATTADLTFVALDEQHRPTEVPRLRPVSAAEKRRYAEAEKRAAARKSILTTDGHG